MICLPSSIRILLFAQPADMRCGFDGLMGLVLRAGEDVYSGSLFVFVSRTKSRAKILTYQPGGFVLWYKRLDRGRFRMVTTCEQKVELDATALAMLLDGIDLTKVVRPKHWTPKQKS